MANEKISRLDKFKLENRDERITKDLKELSKIVYCTPKVRVKT